jgi:hypothetical protein
MLAARLRRTTSAPQSPAKYKLRQKPARLGQGRPGTRRARILISGDREPVTARLIARRPRRQRAATASREVPGPLSANPSPTRPAPPARGPFRSRHSPAAATLASAPSALPHTARPPREVLKLTAGCFGLHVSPLVHVRALSDELTRSRMGLRRQRLIRYRESSRGCRIEPPVFVEEVTAPRAQRGHDHGR